MHHVWIYTTRDVYEDTDNTTTRSSTLYSPLSFPVPLPFEDLSQDSILTGTALGQGAKPSFCLDVQPSNRFMSHSDTPSPGNGLIVSTSCEAMRPLYGEKV